MIDTRIHVHAFILRRTVGQTWGLVPDSLLTNCIMIIKWLANICQPERTAYDTQVQIVEGGQRYNYILSQFDLYLSAKCMQQ